MDTLNTAIIECVKAIGGSKKVGCKLWPEKMPDQAQRHMLDCLNEDRPQRLTPEQLLVILKMARDCGYHGGVAFVLNSLGYAPTHPVEPKDEAADLMRQIVEGQKTMSVLLAKLNIVQTAGGI